MLSRFWVVFLLLVDRSNTKNVGLYPSDGDVVVLTGDNFYQTVLETDNAWIVEFYNSWCGHCIHFAPTWKAIATNVKGWQRVISVAAIDCAVSENMKVCRNYDIGGYPAFKLFLPYCNKNNTGENFVRQNQDDIIHKLVDFVSNDTVKQRAKNWPSLDILSSVEKIWEVVQDWHKHVALIFEDEESVIGRQVILDVCNYKQLLVRRVSSKHAAKFGIRHFPSLYLVHNDGRYQRIAKDVTDRAGFTSALLQLIGVINRIDKVTNNAVLLNKIDEMKVTEKVKLPAAKLEINNTALQVSSNQSFGYYMQDLESALVYCFRQEIAIQRTIEGDALEALRNFVTVIARYFPGKQEIKNFLLRTNVWLEHLASEITGIEWSEKIDSLQSNTSYLPDVVAWKGCAGSHPRYRGYPCSMWMLYHSLTVSAYIASKSNKNLMPTEVLFAVNGYMKYFFGCQECSKNFGKMAASIDTEVMNHKDSVLWLWRAHNKANKRLHGDPSEDPKHPKIQFPSKQACPECYFNDKDPKDIKWNSVQVFKFLVNFYQKTNILKSSENQIPQDTAKKDLDWWELQQRKKDLEKIQQIRLQKRQKLQSKFQHKENMNSIGKAVGEQKPFYFKKTVSGWGLSNVDYGLCVLFYFLCTTLIVVIYYHFIVRRRYKPPCKLLPL